MLRTVSTVPTPPVTCTTRTATRTRRTTTRTTASPVHARRANDGARACTRGEVSSSADPIADRHPLRAADERRRHRFGLPSELDALESGQQLAKERFELHPCTPAGV